MLTLIRCPFHPRVTAVARKRPRSFCQKCRWQVTPKHAYTLAPSKSEWADYAVVQAECRNQSGKELTRNLSGNTWLQLCQGTLGYSCVKEHLVTVVSGNTWLQLCQGTLGNRCVREYLVTVVSGNAWLQLCQGTLGYSCVREYLVTVFSAH